MGITFVQVRHESAADLQVGGKKESQKRPCGATEKSEKLSKLGGWVGGKHCPRKGEPGEVWGQKEKKEVPQLCTEGRGKTLKGLETSGGGGVKKSWEGKFPAKKNR